MHQFSLLDDVAVVVENDDVVHHRNARATRDGFEFSFFFFFVSGPGPGPAATARASPLGEPSVVVREATPRGGDVSERAALERAREPLGETRDAIDRRRRRR